MIGKFFHTPPSKQFNYRPRFYDPDKEEHEDRVKRVKGEMGIVEEKVDDGKPFRANLRGQFRNPDGWQSKSSTDSRKSQNKRLFVFVFVLAIAFYLYFFY